MTLYIYMYTVGKFLAVYIVLYIIFIMDACTLKKVITVLCVYVCVCVTNC